MRRWSALAIGIVCVACCEVALGQDAPETATCLECHGVDGVRPAGESPDGVSVYLGDWEKSVHAILECVDCHSSVEELPHEGPLPRADCSTCHSDEVDLYAASTHGVRAVQGDTLAPSCTSCHDPHSMRDSETPESVLHRTRLAEMCTRCHADENGAGGRRTAVPHPAQSYQRGAHARAMAAGNERAATCKDCHDSHAVRRANDPQSLVYHQNVSHTCGRCHTEEFKAYHASVHNVGVEMGASGSPVCNTCHGEHAVLDLGEPGQTTVVASETCESCHLSPALARRYDLPTGAVLSYEDSYHGRAARGGLAEAAGCTSCHGVHKILSASDPESSTHPGQLVNTCRRCHADATVEFAVTYAHAPGQVSAADRGATIVRNIYVWLIGIVIGGMLLHNGVLFAHDVRKRWLEHKRNATHQRLNRNELRQHLALLSTFALLVFTGFALKYPDTFWARALTAVGMDETLRRILHRVAAVGMIVASVYHVAYMFTARGREQMGHMLPRLRDAREAGENVEYHLGRRQKPPAFSRFRYIEKAEYWALVWGTVVMAATGFILWFPDRIAGPAWLVRVAEAVHLYEAWLAFLAIVVWHFFFVMLRPGTFPVSFTVVTGKMDQRELEHEHPEEYRRVERQRLHRDGERVDSQSVSGAEGSSTDGQHGANGDDTESPSRKPRTFVGGPDEVMRES
jgi:predicted CXXCH cytochrome family protein